MIQTPETPENEQNILEALQSIECNPMEITKIASKLKMKPAKLKKYVEDVAAAEEQRINSQPDVSRNLQQANDLLDNLQDGLGSHQDSCEFDVALVLKTIANTETHPAPSLLDGIDLKQIYSALAQMSMGYPIGDLDEVSKRFLFECYSDISADFDTQPHTETVAKLQQHLTAVANSQMHKSFAQSTEDTLNPALVDSLLDVELNPFDVPAEFLIMK